MQTLVIADGTPNAITVCDVRDWRQWAQSTGTGEPGPASGIYLHHTASALTGDSVNDQMVAMEAAADNDPYGLPYNFVVFPGAWLRVYYLNDVDVCWPHTLGHNCDTAIAAWGDYDAARCPHMLAVRVRRLVRALRTMWGVEVPTYGHREVYATACPGRYLWRELQTLGLTGGR